MTTARIASIASWIVPPIGMAIAYSVLAITSGTDNTGKAWMAIGFAFVLVAWFTLRILIESTALGRAVAASDANRILAIATKQLARRRTDAARAPYLVYRGLAHELRGEHAEAISAITEARAIKDPAIALLAASVHAIALAETGDVAGARRILDDELEPRAAKLDARLHGVPHVHANLARGRVLLDEGNREAAHVQLQRVIDDIRAGNDMRAKAQQLKSR